MKGQCYKSYVDAHKKGTLNAVNLLFPESKGKYEYQQGGNHKGNKVERFCSRHKNLSQVNRTADYKRFAEVV